jgi:hypothetical protein
MPGHVCRHYLGSATAERKGSTATWSLTGKIAPPGRLALPILVGRDLRAAFPGGEKLCLAKPGPAIALVPARRDLPLRYAGLRRNIQAAFGTQIRMTPLPGRLTEALRLADELAR